MGPHGASPLCWANTMVKIWTLQKRSSMHMYQALTGCMNGTPSSKTPPGLTTPTKEYVQAVALFGNVEMPHSMWAHAAPYSHGRHIYVNSSITLAMQRNRCVERYAKQSTQAAKTRPQVHTNAQCCTWLTVAPSPGTLQPFNPLNRRSTRRNLLQKWHTLWQHT